MEIKTIRDIKDLEGKKILLRVDFNVPMQDGEIQDDARIAQSVPTIKYLSDHGAKTIIMSHMGRPKGEVKEELRLTKSAHHLEELLGKKINKLDTILGDEVNAAIEKMQNREIVMLENMRFNPGEEKSEEKFTAELAKLGEIFVNDAFATAHRDHASTAGLARHLPAYGGFLMEKEIIALSPLIEGEPKKPLTMIFGGAKIDTKIGIINNFIKHADYFLIGGAIANTFLYAAGYNVASSLYEEDKAETARDIMMECEKNKERFVIPHDVVVTDEISEDAKALDVPIEDVMGEMKIVDVGKWTAEKFVDIIEKSETVIWNGPLGLFEYPQFAGSSKTIAEALANSKCTSIIGGGDTADCIKKLNIPEEKFTHISTGGGACIEFLSGDKLPGIEILVK